MSENINKNTDLMGKVVVHKSGGPLMVAVDHDEHEITKVTRWQCRWFDQLTTGERAINSDLFVAHELELYEKQPAPVPGPSRADS